LRLPSANVLLAAAVGACSIFLMAGPGLSHSRSASQAPSTSQRAKITIDYPLAGSIFPPEITPPTFLWRDSSDAAQRWVVQVSFADSSESLRIDAPGEHLQMGEIDPQTGTGAELAQLTPEQAATRTWTPDAATWSKIKQSSVKSPATISITGFAASSSDNASSPISVGSVTISTSVDPVGAPVFYRDVPLMTSPHAEKGSIQPLPTSALPLIKWRLRNIAEPQSRTVMTGLYTCANCHSFSRDGKTLGLDVDGPENDKGLYALVPVAKDMTIRNQDVIRWSSFQEHLGANSSEPAVKRFGFMSQISPDGQYVVTSIGAPGAAKATPQNANSGSSVPELSDRLFSINYNDFRFTQVFYPTRGILAWYDRKLAKLRPLPGADDPHFVHTSAFWSPDGKYLIFSQAEARAPYPAGAKKPEYANDPNETQIQYDLYKIPFNDGKGGKAEPVAGASANGMSNSFPKVSPDGRWIVFVQAHNGLLMRPDSKLYIVPFAGGTARLMNCNTPLMNSWHTFSPNGRWLAFSSKARSPYTRLMLTHVDADGNDSPAIIIDNTTAANRAVNIPEFVNVPPDDLENIDPAATKFYRVANSAHDLMQANQIPEAIAEWRKALQMDPDDARAHFYLAVALTRNDQEREAVAEYRKACALDSHQSTWFAHLALAQANTGDLRSAILNYRKAIALDPSNAWAQADLGTVLYQTGQTQEGYQLLRKAVQTAPDFPDGHNQLGTVLAKMGRMDEAVAQLQKAISLAPTSVEYQFNLGFVLMLRKDAAGAVPVFQKTVELSEGKDPRCLAALADAYEKSGRSTQAIQSAQQALDLAIQGHDLEMEKNLRAALERYERDGAKSQPR
jgi:Flp pilus assembly protein TadD